MTDAERVSTTASRIGPQFHAIDIYPPDRESIHFRVVCSYGDLARSCRNRLESCATAWGHFSDVALQMLDEQETPSLALLDGQEDYTSLFDSVMGLDGDTNV